jgi:hypothetical protein
MNNLKFNIKSGQIQKQAKAISEKSTKIGWQLTHLAQALLKLKDKSIRQGSWGVLQGYFFHYRRSNKMLFEKEINVASSVDDLISFEPKALGAYLSFVGLWISAINFLEKEFGKSAEAEIRDLVKGIAALYPEAVKIFNIAQTSFERKGNGGFKLNLVRKIDSAKNACPSLHVQVAAYTFFKVSEIVEQKASDPSLYRPITQAYFEKAVEIIESTMLIRQHVTLDVALGLAILSATEKRFTKEIAVQIINALFAKHQYKMTQEIITIVRNRISQLYGEALMAILSSPDPVYLAAVDFLRKYDAVSR